MDTDWAEALQALAAVAPLAGEVDGAVLNLVTQARRRGATWEDVGHALGVTKQAAHARYSRLLEAEDAPAP